MRNETEVKTDYDTGASSTTGPAPVEYAEGPTIETGKYGTGKPTRVVIRAKVTHGGENTG
jgi:hypothetical protein